MDIPKPTIFAAALFTLRALGWLFAFMAGSAGFADQLFSQEENRAAILIRLEGAVTPASADYIARGLRMAAERRAAILILEMDTPGGLDTSMRGIIRAILASPVPVASFVAPAGARAASAGTYIMYASHLAVMAPGTNLGAATPVAIGGGLPFGGEDEDPAGEDGQTDEAESRESWAGGPRNASEAKAVNDAVAYIRGLAELRGRNADWAEQAVRQAASLSSLAALEENVIDFIARDVAQLLAEANGREVRVGETTVRLETSGLPVEPLEPDWRTRLLSVITDPNVALILMMIGIYGLLFEFLSPGALLPGTLGAVSLLTGLYALAVLPVSYAGGALMLLGIGLIVAEAFAPSFGILGVGGTIALVLGATILFDTDVPGLQLSWQAVGAVGALSLALTLLIMRLAWASHQRAVVTGAEALIGARGVVERWSGNRGYVFVRGERWRATSSSPLREGEEVHVAEVRGLTLKIAAGEPEAHARGEKS